VEYVATNFSPWHLLQLLQAHAVDTYGEFADANEELLKTMPPPLVALQYYKGDDLYMWVQCCSKLRRHTACHMLHTV